MGFKSTIKKAPIFLGIGAFFVQVFLFCRKFFKGCDGIFAV